MKWVVDWCLITIMLMYEIILITDCEWNVFKLLNAYFTYIYSRFAKTNSQIWEKISFFWTKCCLINELIIISGQFTILKVNEVQRGLFSAMFCYLLKQCWLFLFMIIQAPWCSGFNRTLNMSKSVCSFCGERASFYCDQ